MSINITQKDVKTIWRSPSMWLVLAVLSFVSAWLLWQMIDRYVSLQTSLSALPNPPNITTALWQPFVLMLAQLILLPVALTTAMGMTQERAQNTLWYLLINRTSMFPVVMAKFKAQLYLLGFVFLLLLVAALLLAVGGELNIRLICSSFLGFTLFMVWLIALGLMIAAGLQSTGTAVLMNLLIFVLLWLLGRTSVGLEYGVSWLHLLSPVHHLKWFCLGELSLSSLIYFAGGAVLFLWLAALNLNSSRAS